MLKRTKELNIFRPSESNEADAVPSLMNSSKPLFETVDLTSLVQVRVLPSYNAGDVESMEIWLPKSSKQKKIRVYFKGLDKLITLHQCKLEKLQNIKKSILDGGSVC